MNYDNNIPLRVFTSFSGYDSQCMALDRLKQNSPDFDYELVGWSEIDKYAIQAHDAIYPQYADRNYGDISKIDWKQVPDFDLFTYSSPCFVARTLILTENGYKPIEEVKVGDKVLTHTNRYCSVVKIGNKPSSDIYNIKGMMFDDINCTGNHPFYVREMYRYGHESKRAFYSPEWIEAANLTKNHYLGYAINQKSILPEWNGNIDKRFGHSRQVNNLKPMFDKTDFWYLMGRYVGDGWKKESNNGKGIIICHSERNKESLYSVLDRLNIHYCISNERTVTKVTICMNELFYFVDRYGYYAYGKHIDNETLSLPCNLLKAFLDGLLDSDGCYTNNEYKITTVSKELAYGISQCVAKVYHRHSKVNVFHRKPTCVIEGRAVNQRDTYSVSWHIDIRKQDHAFYEDGTIWFPISKLQKKNGIDIVYNLEVEEDHTYTANGAIVHNCQDFSQAGKQQGGVKGSGTRSSLLWECEKCIQIKRPKYLLMENVSALVSSKFIRLFNAWQSTLESYGYKNFAKVLNAKDFQVPQNRERIFLLSIRDDGDEPRFNFPKEMKLGKRLKDILETNVDEKYYLKYENVQALLNATQKHKEKGNGFAFKPHTLEDEYANCVAVGGRGGKTDNFIAEPVVLVWTRDSKGNIIDRHPADVANCVTSGKRENTQNYVVEPFIYGLPHGHFLGGVYKQYSPTVKSSAFAENNPLIEPQIVAMRGRKPQVMTPNRTEYGKSIRKQYEAGEIQEQRKNIQQLEPRTDGVSNTLTSVQKDNLVIEPCLFTIGNLYKGNPQAGRIYDPVGISPTLDDMSSGGLKEHKIIEPINTDEEGNASTLTAGYYKYESKTLLGDTFGTSETAVKESGYRIRKLTERECFRLMDVPEEYIDIIQQSGVSRSQQYKMAGNSIVVSCLYHIFRKAFIETENENSQLTLF